MVSSTSSLVRRKLRESVSADASFLRPKECDRSFLNLRPLDHNYPNTSMLALFEEVPTSTSLLMQCGYRSKVCTNVRATKIDGSLHKLCEFHRRKANANQQRLHKRQREERVARRKSEAATKAKEDRPIKKLCLNIDIPTDPMAVDPIPYTATEAPLDQFYPSRFLAEEPTTPMSLTSVDMGLLELLLLDAQPLPLLFPPNSPTAVDEDNSIVV